MIRNGIDASRYFFNPPHNPTLRNLTEFRDRITSDSTAMRASHDFKSVKLSYPKLKIVTLKELNRVVQQLKETPPNLLEFRQSQAEALCEILEWAWQLQKCEDEQTFLGGIAPSPQDRKEWVAFVKTGYFR